MNDKLLLLINGWAGRSHLLDQVMIFCAKDLIYLCFLMAAVSMAILALHRRLRPIAYFGLTLVFSFAFLLTAAHLYAERRPFMDHHLTRLLAHAAGQSFPSDHTTAAAAAALGLLVFTRFKKTGVLLLLAAALIGFARIFVGVHYPLDILGGFAAAAAGTVVAYCLHKLIDREHVHYRDAARTAARSSQPLRPVPTAGNAASAEDRETAGD